MKKTRVSKLSVALSPYERKIVRNESNKRGLNNFSAALRLIIREWDEGQKVSKPTGSQQAGSAQ